MQIILQVKDLNISFSRYNDTENMRGLFGEGFYCEATTRCNTPPLGAECAPKASGANIGYSSETAAGGFMPFAKKQGLKNVLLQNDLQVISNLSLQVMEGEIVAVVGASGSGKSLLAHAVMGLLPPNAKQSGQIIYKGEKLDVQSMEKLRGSEIALIPQSVQYLNPLMKVGKQVQGLHASRKKTQDVFAKLGLPAQTWGMYPFQLSGGMARRVLFAAAMVSTAGLIIADEPTPGMDAQSAAKALQSLRGLADEGRGVVLITHDVDLAVKVADRLAVFYAGTTLEETAAKNFLRGEEFLMHPYTKALWRAMPQNGFVPLAGAQPYAASLPAGCLFAQRCPQKKPECENTLPPLRALRDGAVRCLNAS